MLSLQTKKTYFWCWHRDSAQDRERRENEFHFAEWEVKPEDFVSLKSKDTPAKMETVQLWSLEYLLYYWLQVAFSVLHINPRISEWDMARAGDLV